MLALKGQAPTQLNYQGIARKPNGHSIPNGNISVRLSIHDGTAAGPVVYKETRAVTTNAFGLFNIAIGSPGATGVIGSVALVNWATGNKYLQVELDPDGGSSFVNLGTSQLLSVPYALYASGAPPVGPAGGDLTGTYPNPTVARIRGVNVTTVAPVVNNILGFDGTNWTPTSLATHPDNYWRFLGGNIYNANGGNVGIGINAPTEKLQVNGNLKTQGFIMPPGAGAGKVLVSDPIGKGSWSSTFTASNILLPYKDSASSETANIFHIIQLSNTSTTGALFGETRSGAGGAFGTGGQVNNASPGAFSAGVRGENLGAGSNGVGVYGSHNTAGYGVYGTAPNGIGVYGNSNAFYGVYGNSNTSSGVFGHSNSGAGYLAGVFGYATNAGGNGTFGYATRADGFGALGIADSSTGVYGQTNSSTYEALHNDGVAVYALATSGGLGVYGNSFSNNAARFENTNVGNTSDVVLATTNSSSFLSTAVHAINGSGGISAGARKGVWGETSDGFGVFGVSNTSSGVVGAANTGIGVQGVSFSGFAAVYADHFANGYGVYSQSNNGVAGRFSIFNPTNASNVLESSTAGLGKSGFFENTNASNGSTTLDVNSIGTGRAIKAQSNMPGFVNGGVIDGLTTTVGGNAVYGRGLRPDAWGVYGLSDSSAGVAGIGIRASSIGVRGQSYSGIAGQFVIDNSLPNTSNTVEVLNTQSGNGITVDLTNPANSARGIDVSHAGNGIGIYSNSNLGLAGRFENTNASNPSTTIEVLSNGTGRSIVARSNMPGYVNGGVVDALTTTLGGNAIYGRGTRTDAWGVYGLSDSAAGVAGIGIRASSIGLFGQSYSGTAGRFVIDNSLANTSNTVEIFNSQTGKGLLVNMTNGASINNGIEVNHDGSGNALNANSFLGTAGKFENFNPGNASTTVDVNSNGTGRAIKAQSNMPGFVNGGVIDGLTTTVGGNAVYGRGLRPDAWGIYGLSDSSAGVAGIGIRASSIGVRGQSYSGIAGQFIIDNSLANASNTVEVSNSQSGKGVMVTMSNPTNNASGIEIHQAGTGSGLFSNSNLGIAAKLSNTNASNASTTLDIRSVGTGRAIFAQSNLPGPVFGGVVDVLTTVNSSNAIFGRATKTLGWGVVGYSDSSAGVAGVGVRAGSVGLFAQGYSGTAGQFLIDNTLPNTSNAVEISNSQTGGGILLNMSNASNASNGIEVNHAGTGNGIYASSNLGIAGRFENLNASNANDLILSTTNGLGRPVEGIINNTASPRAAIRGETNGVGYGVAGIGTNNNTTTSGVYGFHDGTLGNGVIGWGTKALTYGTIGHSDSSVGVYGESGVGNAAYFLSYGSNAVVPTLYAQSNALSNVASFFAANPSNPQDAVVINRVGAGRSLMVSMSSFQNLTNFYDVVNTGKQTARIEGNAGLGLVAHAGGSFVYTGTGERVGVGAYGQADSVGSEYNYGIVGNAKGGATENAGVLGWIAGGAAGSSKNAAIYGVAFAGPGPRFAGLFEGDVQVTGILSKGGGSFKIAHPQDPANKYLVHSFVESPDMMNVYNGNVVTNGEGKAVVDLPGYFEAENKDFKYQLTVIGQFAQAIIGDEIKNNQFTILTDKPNVKVSWQVTGVRNDAFAQKNRIVPEVEKTGKEKGKYLYPELYGQAREDGITFMKSALPAFQGEGKSAPLANARVAESKAMERVNDGVEQKRRMLNNEVEQPTVVTVNKNAAKIETKQMRMPSEKSKSLMAASANATQSEQAKLAATEEKKETQQVTSDKAKQLSTSFDIAQDGDKAKKADQQKGNANSTTTTTSDKAKQLSANTEVTAIVADKKAETTIAPAKQAPPSTDKVKQLANSTSVAKEESAKKIEKPKLTSDSLTLSASQANKTQMKQNTPSSMKDQKKLSDAKVKLPTDQKEGRKD